MHEWIKLHTQILTSEIYSDPTAFRVFLHLLLKADRNGNGIFTRTKCAQELQLCDSTFRNAVERCVQLAVIRTEARTGKYTRYSVENWNKYQTVGDKLQDKPRTNRGQTEDKVQAVYKSREEKNKGFSKFSKRTASHNYRQRPTDEQPTAEHFQPIKNGIDALRSTLTERGLL